MITEEFRALCEAITPHDGSMPKLDAGDLNVLAQSAWESLKADQVPASEYDALCDLFRAVCEDRLIEEADLRYALSREFGGVEIEWAVEILNGAGARVLFVSEFSEGMVEAGARALCDFENAEEKADCLVYNRRYVELPYEEFKGDFDTKARVVLEVVSLAAAPDYREEKRDEGGRTALELVDAWIAVYEEEQRNASAYRVDHRRVLHTLRDVRRLLPALHVGEVQ